MQGKVSVCRKIRQKCRFPREKYPVFTECPQMKRDCKETRKDSVHSSRISPSLPCLAQPNGGGGRAKRGRRGFMRCRPLSRYATAPPSLAGQGSLFQPHLRQKEVSCFRDTSFVVIRCIFLNGYAFLYSPSFFTFPPRISDPSGRRTGSSSQRSSSEPRAPCGSRRRDSRGCPGRSGR